VEGADSWDSNSVEITKAIEPVIDAVFSLLEVTLKQEPSVSVL